MINAEHCFSVRCRGDQSNVLIIWWVECMSVATMHFLSLDDMFLQTCRKCGQPQAYEPDAEHPRVN